MKKHFTIILSFISCLLFLVSASSLQAQQNLTSYVNPFIGTDKRAQTDSIHWEHGQTYPGAVVPWGMVSVSPTTNPNSPSGYFHGEKWLYGFGHSHLSGTGCGDLGSVLLMPTTGEVQTKLSGYRSKYSHEKASPGYYQTTLIPSGINAMMTATTRSGISKYSFPKGKGAHNILLNASFTVSRGMMPTLGHIKIHSSTEMVGWTQSGNFCSGEPSPSQSQKTYFVAQFSAPADSMGTWGGHNAANILTSGQKSQNGRHVGAYFRYDESSDQVIYVKVGISYVSTENARKNLEAEQSGWAFDRIKKQGTERWNKQLSRIEVEGGTRRQKTLFYTGLYHILLEPNVFNDVNDNYLVMGHNGVAKAADHTHYSVFSLWDTYRNVHPFLTLFYPDRQTDMVKSMLDMYKHNGWLPKWELGGGESYVMVGDPAVPVISSTWLNGLHSFDKELAYEAMTHEAMDTSSFNPIRPGLKPYLNKQFIPVHTKGVWGGMSTTLEYNYADYALARFDSAIGKTGDVPALMKRSGYYKNFYDKSSGFLRPEEADGSWIDPFDPTTDNIFGAGFVEGNAWNYLFFVPHDPHGLAKLMGGADQYIKRLQESIDKGYFVMWNEPDMAYPYLFTYFDGASWRTQKAVRETMQRVFTTGPGGLPGNDDCGTTSAWYVFSALGFYPANPASGKFRLGSPIFDKVTIHLNQKYYDGKTFMIEASGASNENIYTRSIKLNGRPYKKVFITHKNIENGGTLSFELSNKPNKR